MKLRDVAIRFRSRPLAPLSGIPLEAQFACLEELRRELTASYPSILIDRLVSIARRHGLDRFPEGFLVSGSLADRGPAGARARLRAIRRTASGQDAPPHPLFSDGFYRLCNPDVAATGTPAWAHYQVFGRSENRSPHPLIDVSHLAAWLPDTSRGSVVDEYLMIPDNWTADPGPYVDCQKFLLHGNWDGTTNPLVQIVTRRLGAPWVHQRLLLVDSDSDLPDVARLTAIGYLLSRSTARARLSRLWASSRTTALAGEHTATAEFVVVPGFFLGAAGGTVAEAATTTVSPDLTVVRLHTEYVGIRSGSSVPAEKLYFVDRELGADALRSLVEASPKGTAVAAFSGDQEATITALARELARTDLTVLPWGRQVRVTGATLGALPAGR